MKTTQFIIFFSVVLLVYFSVNYYIYVRGIQAIPVNSSYRMIYRILFFFLASSFVISRFAERIIINPATESLVWLGGIWLGAMLYFFLFIVVFDILRLGNHFFNFFPSFLTDDYPKIKLIAFLGVNAAVIIILTAGYLNAIRPNIKEISINIDKKAGNITSLKIAMASDIHLGTMISNGRLAKLVNEINSMNPDIILLAGDVVDESIEPIIKYNIGENLRKFRSKYGVYAITGNHEYIGGVEKAVKYCEEHGMTFLRDKSILIDSAFFLVGREDRDMSRFAGRKRKPLPELLNGLDKNLPIIVMNHQPFELAEAVENGVDLHLSGHTHHGQLWPLNFITKAVYEISWGYKKTGNTNFYVSSGYGTWGPPFRTGNTPEILLFKVKFRD